MAFERRGLETIVAVAEIAGAVAVVVSLLYLAGEVRGNTAATQAAAYQEVVRASNEYLLALAQDPALAEIVVRAESDASTLTPVERRRYFSYRRVFWRNMDNAYVQHKRGVLADSEWEVYRVVACNGRARNPDWSWNLHKGSLSPDFAAAMDGC